MRIQRLSQESLGQWVPHILDKKHLRYEQIKSSDNHLCQSVSQQLNEWS